MFGITRGTKKGEIRSGPPMAAQGEGFDLLRDLLEPADAGPNLAPIPGPVLFRQLEARLIDRHLGGGDPDLAEACHALCFLEIHVLAWIEVLELRHRLDRQVGDVEGGRDPKSGASLDQAVPELDQVDAIRG